MDARIEADTLAVTQTRFSIIRLMNDQRWPWLMLLPINSDATELHHLDDAQRLGYLDDVNQLSQLIQQHTKCKSVNVAMIGNVVAALHCHVVARFENDPNWPKPIWGFEQAIPYENNLPDALLNAITQTLADK